LLNELIAISYFLAGLLLLVVGLYFFRRDYKEYLNQLLGLSLTVLGFSMVADAIPLFFQNVELFVIAEYIMAFSVGIGTGAFFLSGVTLVKGETDGKSPLYVIPTVILSLAPGTVILLLGSIVANYDVILGDNVLISNWGEIGDIVTMVVLFLFIIGSLAYFFRVYRIVEDGETKESLKYFLIGMTIMAILTVGINIPLVIIEVDALAEFVVSIVSIPISISVGSSIIIYGLVKS